MSQECELSNATSKIPGRDFNGRLSGAAASGAMRAPGHFMQYGWREGRDHSAAFDISAYMDRYLDVGASRMNPPVRLLGLAFAKAASSPQ